jgi:O-antigen/teichoic acid export membrane protein
MLVCNVACYRLCVQGLGDEIFAEYSVARRNLSYVVPALASAVGTPLTHFIAKNSSLGRSTGRDFLSVAIVMQSLLLAPLVLFGFIFPELTSQALFASPEQADLIYPLLWCLVGMSSTSLCFYFLMGEMQVTRAVFLNAVAGGLLPVVAVVASKSGADIFYIQAIGMLLISMVVYLLFIRPRLALDDHEGGLREKLRQFAGYGLPRIPGAFAISALVTLPMTLTAHHKSDLEIAALLGVGGTFLTMAGAAVAPLATILLPLASHVQTPEAKRKLRGHAKTGFLTITGLALPIILLVALQIEPLIGAFLNPTYGTKSSVILWILPTMLPFAYYRFFSSILDGVDSKAWNSLHCQIGLVVFGLWWLLATQLGWPEPPLQAHLVGMYILGLLTLVRVHWILLDE